LNGSSAAITDEALANTIAAGAASLDFHLSPAQVQAFVDYLRTIEHWNATYNLTAIRDPAAMVPQHLLDCLATASALARRREAPNRQTILDVGSGAGLPGLVLAVVYPESEIFCVDSVGKKTAFITQAAAVMRATNVVELHARVEALSAPRCDVVTSRAFAPLADFVRLTRHLLAENGEWMAMKAREAATEAAGLRDVEVSIEPLVVPGLAAERCLVWIKPR
jgi:16S rRNA (guanine527-N7)-methyltransferase